MSNEKTTSFGVAWEKTFDNSNLPKYNVSIDPSLVKKLPANDKGNVSIVLQKRDTPNEKNGITHDVVLPGSPKKDDVVLSINLEELSKIPLVKDNTTYLEAIGKKEIERDRSNFHVRQMQVEKGEKPIYVGRGWSESQKVVRHYVGNAMRVDFENGGRMYNLSLTKEEFDKINANQFGNVVLAVAPKKDSDNKFSVYRSVGPDPYSTMTVSVNKKEIEAMGADKNGYYQLIVADKQKIGKNHADMTVMENTYHKEKKQAEAEGKDVKDVKFDKNYVGDAWSSSHKHIRLQKSDFTQKALASNIADNHSMKVMAIITINPELARQKHVKLMDEMIAKGDVPVNKEVYNLVKHRAGENEQQSQGMKA